MLWRVRGCDGVHRGKLTIPLLRSGFYSPLGASGVIGLDYKLFTRCRIHS